MKLNHIFKMVPLLFFREWCYSLVGEHSIFKIEKFLFSDDQQTMYTSSEKASRLIDNKSGRFLSTSPRILNETQTWLNLKRFIRFKSIQILKKWCSYRRWSLSVRIRQTFKKWWWTFMLRSHRFERWKTKKKLLMVLHVHISLNETDLQKQNARFLNSLIFPYI